MSPSPFPRLFSPFAIGGVALRNRIVCLPHATQLADPPPFGVGERMIAYYRERARGGAGLITYSAMPVFPASGARPSPGKPDAERFRALTEAVHAEGAAIFSQLSHGSGREVPGPPGRRPPVPLAAPSPVACPTGRFDPHVLTRDEIRAYVAATAETARLICDAGFDGLEFHATHAGYLLQQFLSPASNRREDEYGGSLENRMRFVREALEAARDAVGDRIVVGARLSVEEFVPGGLEEEEGVEVAVRLAAGGLVDYLSVDGGTYAHYDTIFPDMATPPGAFVPLAAAVKRALPALPVIASHRINNPAQAEQILVDGAADLIGMARALIADPELPRKAAAGEGDRIRRCVACNEGCLRSLMDMIPITCVQNPAAGHEREWGIGTLRSAERARRVLVIGGGPGGLKAATVAAARGHEVTLCERADELGGQVAMQARVASRREIGEIIAHLEIEARHMGVDIRLGCEITADNVGQFDSAVVILATGSRPLKTEFCNLTPDQPALPGVEADWVYTLDEVLNGRQPSGHVLVVDNTSGDYRAPAVAEYLADSGLPVQLVTTMNWVGMDVPKPNQRPLYRRLWSKRIQVMPHRALQEIRRGAVTVTNVFTFEPEEIEPVDSVVFVSGRRSNDELRTLFDDGREVFMIGDCVAPRTIGDAIREGEAVGRAL